MNEQLTPRQQRAIESLIICASIRSAAKHAQIGERTLYRWLQEDEFQSAVRRARQLSLTQLATHMQHMADRALGTLSAAAWTPSFLGRLPSYRCIASV